MLKYRTERSYKNPEIKEAEFITIEIGDSSFRIVPTCGGSKLSIRKSSGSINITPCVSNSIEIS